LTILHWPFFNGYFPSGFGCAKQPGHYVVWHRQAAALSGLPVAECAMPDNPYFATGKLSRATACQVPHVPGKLTAPPASCILWSGRGE